MLPVETMTVQICYPTECTKYTIQHIIDFPESWFLASYADNGKRIEELGC